MGFIKIAVSTLIISISILSVDLSQALQKQEIEGAQGPLGKVDFPVSCSPEAQIR
jgi:hypothetical protein